MELHEKPVKTTNGSRSHAVNADAIEEPSSLDIKKPFNKTKEITQIQEQKRRYQIRSWERDQNWISYKIKIKIRTKRFIDTQNFSLKTKFIGPQNFLDLLQYKERQ